MITLSVLQAVFILYAILLVIGGFIGFAKAGSRPSLIAGVVSGVAVLLAAYLILWKPGLGMGIGALAALALTGFFGRRYLTKGRKFMPAGLMAVASVLVLVFIALGLF